MKRFLLYSTFMGVIVAAFMLTSYQTTTAGEFPVEAGPVKFMRDHDKAMEESKKTGKPVFAFLQEIPG